MCLSVAALGMYVFLSRVASRPAAALGAMAFALSGGVVSTVNTPNLAWSVALVPWVLAAAAATVATRSARSVAALGLAFGTLALAGEPMTLLATAALVVLFAAFGDRADGSDWRARGRDVALVLAGGALGALVAGVVLLPLAEAVARSSRSAGPSPEEWALAPWALAETVLPSVFGTVLEPADARLGWYRFFNDGREPLLLSVYLGVPALVLAAAGTTSRHRRWSIFWVAVAAVAVVCALGAHTPIYPALQRLVPLASTFRFPAKFFVFAALAVSALAAVGWDALEGEGARRAARSAVAAAALAVPLAAALVWLYGFAPDATAVLAAGALGLAALSAAGAWYAAAARPRVALVRGALVGLVALDLLVANGGLNPTLDVAMLSRPAWVDRVAPGGERLFQCPRSDLGYVPNVPPSPSIPPGMSLAEANAIKHAAYPLVPTVWDVRGAVSVDVSHLMPRAYGEAAARYGASTRGERERFLERAGVRFYLVPDPPAADARRLEQVESVNARMGLFERPVYSPRAEVVATYEVLPESRDQIALLVSSLHDPSRTAILAAEPLPEAGAASEPREASARIVRDEQNAITVEADVPEGGGFLVLRDTYDPNWRVEVDGREAACVRANAIFRAVRLAPGSYRIDLTYRPTLLAVGAGVSLAALALALALVVLPRRRAVAE